MRQEEAARYVKAVCRELELRKDYLADVPVTTVYFGGGTPSRLTPQQLGQIISTIDSVIGLKNLQELTVECNPDDITPQYVTALRALGVNRISMGVQTFSDALLRLLNRRHTSQQALEAVRLCREAGYTNISLDLIYGLPGQTLGDWEDDVRQVLTLGVPHLSAYALSFEEGTALSRMLQEGRVEEAPDELSWQMYEYLMDQTAAAGMEHYEISNFARPGMFSRHNSSYWDGSPYLGLGPGAHSFDGGNVRRSNDTSLKDYVRSTADVPHQNEVLTPEEQYDELVMTRLRTASGLHLGLLTPEQKSYCMKMAEPHILRGDLLREGLVLRLSRKGIFISNSIISDLMR